MSHKKIWDSSGRGRAFVSFLFARLLLAVAQGDVFVTALVIGLDRNMIVLVDAAGRYHVAASYTQ